MRILTDNDKKRENVRDRTNKLIDGLDRYIDCLSDVQEQVTGSLINEFGTEGSIDTSSFAKFARITSFFASAAATDMKGQTMSLNKIFIAWQATSKSVFELKKADRRTFAAVPARLAFCYFLNAEYYKALISLRDYIHLIPDDESAYLTMFRWLSYLGEFEILEKMLKEMKSEYKKDASSAAEDLYEMCEVYIEYSRIPRTRQETLKKLRAFIEKWSSTTETSFVAYEMSSFVCWVSSTLANVARSADMTDAEFPDPLMAIVTASNRADSIVRNRLRGLSPTCFNNSETANFRTALLQKGNNPADFIKNASGIAWLFELRREMSYLYLSSAQARDVNCVALVNWRFALRTALTTRVLQALNQLHMFAYSMDNKNGEMLKLLNAMRLSTENILSPAPTVVRCSTPIHNDREQGLTPVSTPLLGRKQIKSTANDELDELQHGMETMRVIDEEVEVEVEVHAMNRNCGCEACRLFYVNMTMVSEYFLAQALCSKFSMKSINEMTNEYEKARGRISLDQCELLKEKARPRPPVLMCETIGTCVALWQAARLERREKASTETRAILEMAIKITKYSQIRTLRTMLIVRHMMRCEDAPFDRRYSWMTHSTSKPLMRATINCAKDVLRAISPFGRRPPRENGEPATTSSRSDEKSKEQEALMGAKKDFQQYGHILSRDWRFSICTFIGRASPEPWDAAFSWSEATLIGTRSAHQMSIGVTGKVSLKDATHLQRRLSRMPDDMTVIQLSCADNKDVYMTKLHKNRAPICVPIASHSKMTELVEKLHVLLDEDERVAKNPGDMTCVRFWEVRRAIDERMKLFVGEVEAMFLGAFAPLMMPSGTLGEKATLVAKKIEKLSEGKIRSGEAKEIVWLGGQSCVSEKSWEALVARFCELRNVENKEACATLTSIHRYCRQALERDETSVDEKRYTYLIVCPELSQFPWEALPVFEKNPFVSRMFSIHSVFAQLEATPEIPIRIDINKSYYVLNPDKNLASTEERMLEYIKKFNWAGVVGGAPKTADVVTALENLDAFFFVGHGSGSKYFSRSAITNSKCRAVSMLMGCSSVRTIPQGPGFDGKSVLFDYALARCPLVVGCLWTVTDGEIDRFMMRMLDTCFLPSDGKQQMRFLCEAMKISRESSKLKYLTGAAVVTYGLPLMSKERDVIALTASSSAEMILKEAQSKKEVAAPSAPAAKKASSSTTASAKTREPTPEGLSVPKSPSRVLQAVKSASKVVMKTLSNEDTPTTPKKIPLATSKEATNVPSSARDKTPTRSADTNWSKNDFMNMINKTPSSSRRPVARPLPVSTKKVFPMKQEDKTVDEEQTTTTRRTTRSSSRK